MHLAQRLFQCVAGTLGILVLVTLSVAKTSIQESRQQPEFERWHWVAPAALKLATADLSSIERTLDPEQNVQLAPGQVLLIPARRGDQFSIEGGPVAAGIANGTNGPLPDAITWHHEIAPKQIRIPTWSAVRFLALRASQNTQVRVQIATDTPHPLADYRLNNAVFHWLDEQLGRPSDGQGNTPATTPPRASYPSTRRDLDALQGLTQWMRKAVAGHSSAQGTAKRWLYSQWLKQTLHTRALRRPFFVREPFVVPSLAVASKQPVEAPWESGWMTLSPEQPLQLPHTPAEVYRILLRAQSVGRSTVEIHLGNRLWESSTFRVARRSKDPTRWTPTRTLRIVPQGEPLRLTLLKGAVRVKIDGFTPRSGIVDPRAAHSSHGIAAAQPPVGPGWLEKLSRLQTLHDGQAGKELWASLSAPTSTSALPHGQANRALLLHVLLPTSESRWGAPALWREYWRRTAALPEAQRDALRISVLQRAFRHSNGPWPVAWSPVPVPKAERDTDSPPVTAKGAQLTVRRQLVHSLLEAVFTPLDRQRPTSLNSLDTALALHPSDRQGKRLLRQAWSRVSPWVALQPKAQPQRLMIRSLSEQPGPSGLCSTVGEHGLRWWVVPKTPQTIAVKALGGTHSVLLFRPLDNTVTDSSEVSVSGVPIAIHSLLAEPSRAAVRPGIHSISRSLGPPVVAKIPWETQLPCGQLREGELWTSLQSELQYELPPGDTSTIASFIINPDSKINTAIRLIFQIDQQTVRGELRSTATGDIAFVIPPHARLLTVSTSRPVQIRARLRLHPSTAPASSKPPITTSGSSTASEPLEQLTRLTRQLAQTRSPERRVALRVQRGDLLFTLGYRSMAHQQWARGQLAPAQRDWSQPGALFLPHRTVPVLALGLPARAPPSSEEELFLSARLASKLEHRELSGRLFERLAHQTQHSAFSQAAARQYDKLAEQTQRLDYTRRAYTLAQASSPDEAAVRSLLSRYSPLVQWRAPSLSALGQSTVRIESRQREFRARSPGIEMQRALLDAPHSARLLHSSTKLSLSAYRNQTLQLRTLCFARETATERCRVRLSIDDTPLVCDFTAQTPARDVPAVQQCTFPVAPGTQRLQVELPAESKPVAWLELKSTVVGSPPSLSQVTRYALLPPGHIAEMHLQGPAALRLRVRRMGAGAGHITIETTGERGPPLAPKVLTLSAALDPTARTKNGAEPISLEERFSHVILGAGAHRITLRAAGAIFSVRPEIAQLTGPPAARVLPLEQEAHQTVTQSSNLATPLAEAAFHEAGLPLAFGVSTLIKDRDLSDTDNDRRDRYVQIATRVRKRIDGQPIWLASEGFARFRQGPLTLGMASRADFQSPQSGWSGSINLRAAFQPATQALGWGSTLNATYRTRAIAGWPLVVRGRFTSRSIDRNVRDQPGVDGQIYSAYAAARPHSWDLELDTRRRPFIDTRLKYALAIRLDPGVSSVDRVVARVVAQSLFGQGWAPWLRLAFESGYRPATRLRSSDFLRWKLSSRAIFWHWLNSKQRLRTDLSLSVFVDAPGDRFGLFFSLGASFDQWGARGLGEQPPSSFPYRERLEEAGPKLSPRTIPTDLVWRDEARP